MGYQFRLLDDADTEFWINSHDKQSAIQELHRRCQIKNANQHAIPYYLTGRKQRDRVPPLHHNGRLRVNAFGQTRHYLDWELAQHTDGTLTPAPEFNTQSR